MKNEIEESEKKEEIFLFFVSCQFIYKYLNVLLTVFFMCLDMHKWKNLSKSVQIEKHFFPI